MNCWFVPVWWCVYEVLYTMIHHTCDEQMYICPNNENDSTASLTIDSEIAYGCH